MENPILIKRQIELLLEEAKRELEKDPTNQECLTLIPTISALGDSYNETLLYLEKTLARVRTKPSMYLLKAHCHLKLKEYDLMKQEYLRFTKAEAGKAYWEEDIQSQKITDQEELADFIKIITAETKDYLQPLLNAIRSQE